MKKKTLVIGASTNPDRYSHLAVLQLRENGHEVIAIGNKAGTIGDVEILIEWPKDILDLDTITLYLSPKYQNDYYEGIISSGIKRLMFNPGTENPELYMMARKKGIISTNACTLVQLSIGNY